MVVGRAGSRPVFNTEFIHFAQHYSTTPKACPPYSPWVKGKRAFTYLQGIPGEILYDNMTAILDRLLHHSQVVNIKGHSYRLRGHSLAKQIFKEQGKNQPDKPVQ